jgi:hypothetical protein
MPTAFLVPDRRLPFVAVLADCLVCVLVFPVAAVLAAPVVPTDDGGRRALAVLPLALLLINLLIILLDPPEPLVWSVPRAVLAGVWRATLVFICLLWTLLLSGHAAVVPVGLFMTAWGCLVVATAILRALRLLLVRRIPL